MLTPTRRLALSTVWSLVIWLALAGQASAELFWGLTTANTLVRFSSADPGTILRTLPVTGLQPGERLQAIEAYAVEGTLVGLGSTGTLYSLDRETGHATLIRAVPLVPTPAIAFGMSEQGFLLHVVSSANYALLYKTWDGGLRRGIDPPGQIVAITVTTDGRRIVLDSLSDQVYVLNDPPGLNMTLTPVGPLGVDTSEHAGLDLASVGDGLWATLTVGGVSGLYMIDAAAGAATLIGSIASPPVVSLAVDMPGTPQVTPLTYQRESAISLTMTVRRTGDISGPAEYDVMADSTSPVSATAGQDYVAFDQLMAFAPGEIEKQFQVTLQNDIVREPLEELHIKGVPRPGNARPWAAVISIEDDDNAAPVITLTSPASPVTVTSPAVTLTGSVTDEDSGVVLYHNASIGGYFIGGPFTSNPWTMPDVPLQPGLNRIGVMARDVFGAYSIAYYEIIRAVPNEQTFVFAEGATGTFFDTNLLFANPNPAEVPVTIDFMRPDGSVVTHALTLPADRRTTLSVDAIPGLESTAVAATVRTSSYPIAVERTMQWGEGGYGAHTEKASGLSQSWFFAEGSQGFFHTYLLLVNPHATENEATVRFLREGNTPVTRTVTLAPHERLTIDAGTVPEVVDRAFGMEVRFTRPAVAERAMYFGADPVWAGGHASAGVPEPANEWFLAEGTTGWLMETFVLLANPASEPADVTLRFLPDTGVPVTRVKTIPAGGRLTVNIEGEDPALANVTVATAVAATRPIVVERAQYWPGPPDQWYESHGSFGVTRLATHQILAEGRVGGPSGYQTYILLANTFESSATVTLRLLPENDAPPIIVQVVVPANSRFTLPVDGSNQGLGIVEGSFSVDITSDLPIAVERSMYASHNFQSWASGTNATASSLP